MDVQDEETVTDAANNDVISNFPGICNDLVISVERTHTRKPYIIPKLLKTCNLPASKKLNLEGSRLGNKHFVAVKHSQRLKNKSAIHNHRCPKANCIGCRDALLEKKPRLPSSTVTNKRRQRLLPAAVGTNFKQRPVAAAGKLQSTAAKNLLESKTEAGVKIKTIGKHKSNLKLAGKQNSKAISIKVGLKKDAGKHQSKAEKNLLKLNNCLKGKIPKTKVKKEADVKRKIVCNPKSNLTVAGKQNAKARSIKVGLKKDARKKVKEILNGEKRVQVMMEVLRLEDHNMVKAEHLDVKKKKVALRIKKAIVKRPKTIKSEQTWKHDCNIPPCDDDHWIYCELCHKQYHGECPLHGEMLHIVDNKPSDMEMSTTTLARASIPDVVYLETSSIKDAGLGIFAKEAIADRVRFGPYVGINHKDEESESNYQWEVIKNKEKSHYIDAFDENRSNWMRFINCARTECEQNLVAIQYHGQIFYHTYKPIEPGQELLVWYGRQFGSTLGLCNSQDDSEESIIENDAESPNGKRKVARVCPLKFRCSFAGCFQKFYKEADLQTHLRSAHELRKCTKCNIKFKTVKKFRKHLALKHQAGKPYLCEFCGKIFQFKNELLCHKQTHESTKFICSKCDRRFLYRRSFIKHQNNCNGADDDAIVCGKCHKAFSSSFSFKFHPCNPPTASITEREPFESEQGVLCNHPDCGHVSPDMASLLTHRRLHRSYLSELHSAQLCQLCNSVFVNEGNLVNHVKLKHDIKIPYICRYCDFESFVKVNYRRHMKNFHWTLKGRKRPSHEELKKIEFNLHLNRTTEASRLMSALKLVTCDSDRQAESSIVEFAERSAQSNVFLMANEESSTAVQPGSPSSSQTGSFQTADYNRLFSELLDNEAESHQQLSTSGRESDERGISVSDFDCLGDLLSVNTQSEESSGNGSSSALMNAHANTADIVSHFPAPIDANAPTQTAEPSSIPVMKQNEEKQYFSFFEFVSSLQGKDQENITSTSANDFFANSTENCTDSRRPDACIAGNEVAMNTRDRSSTFAIDIKVIESDAGKVKSETRLMENEVNQTEEGSLSGFQLTGCASPAANSEVKVVETMHLKPTLDTLGFADQNDAAIILPAVSPAKMWYDKLDDEHKISLSPLPEFDDGTEALEKVLENVNIYTYCDVESLVKDTPVTGGCISDHDDNQTVVRDLMICKNLYPNDGSSVSTAKPSVHFVGNSEKHEASEHVQPDKKSELPSHPSRAGPVNSQLRCGEADRAPSEGVDDPRLSDEEIRKFLLDFKTTISPLKSVGEINHEDTHRDCVIGAKIRQNPSVDSGFESVNGARDNIECELSNCPKGQGDTAGLSERSVSDESVSDRSDVFGKEFAAENPDLFVKTGGVDIHANLPDEGVTMNIICAPVARAAGNENESKIENSAQMDEKIRETVRSTPASNLQESSILDCELDCDFNNDGLDDGINSMSEEQGNMSDRSDENEDQSLSVSEPIAKKVVSINDLVSKDMVCKPVEELKKSLSSQNTAKKDSAASSLQDFNIDIVKNSEPAERRSHADSPPESSCVYDLIMDSGEEDDSETEEDRLIRMSIQEYMKENKELYDDDGSSSSEAQKNAGDSGYDRKGKFPDNCSAVALSNSENHGVLYPCQESKSFQIISKEVDGEYNVQKTICNNSENVKPRVSLFNDTEDKEVAHTKSEKVEVIGCIEEKIDNRESLIEEPSPKYAGRNLNVDVDSRKARSFLNNRDLSNPADYRNSSNDFKRPHPAMEKFAWNQAGNQAGRQGRMTNGIIERKTGLSTCVDKDNAGRSENRINVRSTLPTSSIKRSVASTGKISSDVGETSSLDRCKMISSGIVDRRGESRSTFVGITSRLNDLVAKKKTLTGSIDRTTVSNSTDAVLDGKCNSNAGDGKQILTEKTNLEPGKCDSSGLGKAVGSNVTVESLRTGISKPPCSENHAELKDVVQRSIAMPTESESGSGVASIVYGTSSSIVNDTSSLINKPLITEDPAGSRILNNGDIIRHSEGTSEDDVSNRPADDRNLVQDFESVMEESAVNSDTCSSPSPSTGSPRTNEESQINTQHQNTSDMLYRTKTLMDSQAVAQLNANLKFLENEEILSLTDRELQDFAERVTGESKFSNSLKNVASRYTEYFDKVRETSRKPVSAQSCNDNHKTTISCSPLKSIYETRVISTSEPDLYSLKRTPSTSSLSSITCDVSQSPSPLKQKSNTPQKPMKSESANNANRNVLHSPGKSPFQQYLDESEGEAFGTRSGSRYFNFELPRVRRKEDRISCNVTPAAVTPTPVDKIKLKTAEIVVDPSFSANRRLLDKGKKPKRSTKKPERPFFAKPILTFHKLPCKSGTSDICNAKEARVREPRLSEDESGNDVVNDGRSSCSCSPSPPDNQSRCFPSRDSLQEGRSTSNQSESCDDDCKPKKKSLKRKKSLDSRSVEIKKPREDIIDESLKKADSSNLLLSIVRQKLNEKKTLHIVDHQSSCLRDQESSRTPNVDFTTSDADSVLDLRTVKPDSGQNETQSTLNESSTDDSELEDKIKATRSAYLKLKRQIAQFKKRESLKKKARRSKLIKRTAKFGKLSTNQKSPLGRSFIKLTRAGAIARYRDIPASSLKLVNRSKLKGVHRNIDDFETRSLVVRLEDVGRTRDINSCQKFFCKHRQKFFVLKPFLVAVNNCLDA